MNDIIDTKCLIIDVHRRVDSDAREEHVQNFVLISQNH